MAEKQQLIADIMGAQQELRSLFTDERSDPLFRSHLTLSQLRILILLERNGTLSGGELARLLGVGLAASSGMIDRLVAQDLVARSEDQHDRRVRRIALTRTGSKLIEEIFNAGQEKMRTLLSRLSAEELDTVARATALLVKAAQQEPSPRSGAVAGPADEHPSARPGAMSGPADEHPSARPGAMSGPADEHPSARPRAVAEWSDEESGEA